MSRRVGIGRLARGVVVATLLLSATGILAAPRAEGSSYQVRQCANNAGFPSAPDAQEQGSTMHGAFGNSFNFYALCDSGWSWLSITPAGANLQGQYAQHVFKAPAGTIIDEATFKYGITHASSYRGVVFHKPRNGGQTNLDTTEGMNKERTIGTDSEYLGAGLYCNANGCPSTWSPIATIGDVRLTMRDEVRPSNPGLFGDVFTGRWVSGDQSMRVVANDTGAGVDRITMKVNGSERLLGDFCNPPIIGGYTARLSPCASAQTHVGSTDTRGAEYREGANTVEICVHEYGSSPQSNCRAATVNVDNRAPTAPTALEVIGGSGWRSTNDFELKWNPSQSTAPINASVARITGSGYDSGWTYRSGSTDRRKNVSVPRPGEYKVQVALVDEAGNVDYSNYSTTTIRFDNEAPEGSQPDVANGWINADDLRTGYGQEWRLPQDTPISGIKGYAVRTDQSRSTDPCDPDGSGGPGEGCSDSEVNFPGVDNRSTTLGSDDLAEGSNWVHVASVSGAGVKTGELRHTELKVDTKPPLAALRGAVEGWSRGDVDLMVEASDERSGMTDTDDYPNDAPPVTAVEVDGGSVERAGASSSATVSGDGIHHVRYWARDLAGNTSEPSKAEVRIDGTAPEARLEPLDKTDPELIAAIVSDHLSGIRSAELQYREDAGEWLPIEAKLTGNRVAGRLFSEQMSEDSRYAFRVVATDNAGNEARSTHTKSGEERVQDGRLRDSVEIADLRINGKRRSATVKYRRGAQLTGRLIDDRGRLVSGVPLTVIESYASGSRRAENQIATTSNGDGKFAASLPKGPSRRVGVRFDGSPTLLAAAEQRGPELRVRGKIGLKVTKSRVRPGKATRFKGSVGKAGATVPGGGKLVEVQVRVRNKWRTVDKALRTNRKGRFNLKYRFGRFYNQPVRFKFRAVALDEEGWPYKAPVKSKRQSVTVVP